MTCMVVVDVCCCICAAFVASRAVGAIQRDTGTVMMPYRDHSARYLCRDGDLYLAWHLSSQRVSIRALKNFHSTSFVDDDNKYYVCASNCVQQHCIKNITDRAVKVLV